MSKVERGYNGYANYETWLVNLWLTNDYGTSKFFEEIIENLRESYYHPEYAFSQWLKDYLIDYVYESLELKDMYLDLMIHSLENVDFYEIAEIWCEEK